MEKFHGCMILLLFAGKLSRLYSNSKHLIITKKKFADKLSPLEANPQKPRKFSTVNDLHYTVFQQEALQILGFVVSVLEVQNHVLADHCTMLGVVTLIGSVEPLVTRIKTKSRDQHINL